MQVLFELTNQNLGLKPKETNYRFRSASRVVLMNGSKVGVIHFVKAQFYKIPGGGIEGNETPLEAVKRETLEETGCTIKNIKELGLAIERRDEQQLIQYSYVFVADVKKIGKPAPTSGEAKMGAKLEWVSIKKAIQLFKKIKPKDEGGEFMKHREVNILKIAKKKVFG